MDNEIDYRKLLKKYIDYVWQEEGTTFTWHIDHDKKNDFTKEEIEELKKLESEEL